MKEKPIRVTVLTRKELDDVIYSKSTGDLKKRFRPSEEGGVFKYFYARDVWVNINRDLDKEIFFPVVKEGGKIVAIAKIQKSPYEENLFWANYICVDPKYQGRGHATRLVREILQFAKDHGVAIKNSFYTKEGELKMKKIWARLVPEYGVEFREDAI
jgi:GNAT superfamily N-acetyltransferase